MLNKLPNRLRRVVCFVSLLALLSSSFFIAANLDIKPAQAAGPTSWGIDINQPTTWTLENSPYLIPRNIRININSILTIEPGVVVKFNPNHIQLRYSSIYVHGANGGKIIAQGTQNEPIVFTSVYDNEYDDLTGTWNDPVNGDWGSLVFYDDESILDNVIVRYAGNSRDNYANLEFRTNSRAQISNSTVEYSDNMGILIGDDAQPVLDNLTIQNNDNTALITRATAGPGILKNSVIQNNGGAYLLDLNVNSLFQFENNDYNNNASQRIELSGNVEGDVTWRNLGLPYVIYDKDITVTAGNTLTIEPGTIIKLHRTDWGTGYYGSLRVQGSLQAIGTAASPIIFTSFHDDIGGDTNGDGDLTLPQPKDWGEIRFINSLNNRLEHTHIRYAGRYGRPGGIDRSSDSIYLNNSQAEIVNSIIEYSDNMGLYAKDSTFTLTDSQINNNQTGIRISTPSALPTIKDNLIYNNSGGGLSYSGTEELDAILNWWGDDSGPTHPDNPNGTGDAISGNVLFDPWIGKDPDPVIIVPGIMGSWYKDGEWRLDPLLHTFDDLWEALKQAGYQEGVDLFAFPYQWRNSNVQTANGLKDKIDQVQQITGKNKVDIIAHSMGGLVTRYYIENELYLGDNDGIDEVDIDQLIFLGTPHRGSPKSYLSWEGAEFIGVFDNLIRTFLNFERYLFGYDSLFGYIQARIKSAEQLLPSYAYLRDIGQTELREYDPLNYPDNYPYNIFLENLNSPTYLDKLTNSSVRILNIIGDNGNNTIGEIEVSDGSQYSPMWEHGYEENYIKLAGDDTVPESSSSFFTSIKIDNAKHSQIPTKAQKEIIEFLTDTVPTIEVVDTPAIQEILVVQAYSPIDFQVIAPNGEIIGKDFDNNTEINQIDYAFYSGFNEEGEFVLIINPLDGEYSINVVGTDEGGDYGLVVSNIDEESGQESSVYGTIITNEAQSYTFNYDDELTEPVVIEPVIEEITVDEVIQDVRDIIQNGGFKYAMYGKILIYQLKLIKRWEEKMKVGDHPDMYKRLILRRLEFMKIGLKWRLKVGRINQDSYDILINNFNLLIKNYQ